MHVRFQDTAEADLDAISDYFEDKSPRKLDRVLSAILTLTDKLALFPFMGRSGKVAGTRELSVPRTDYLIVYTLDDPHFIDIIRIIHTRTNYPKH